MEMKQEQRVFYCFFPSHYEGWVLLNLVNQHVEVRGNSIGYWHKSENYAVVSVKAVCMKKSLKKKKDWDIFTLGGH